MYKQNKPSGIWYHGGVAGLEPGSYLLPNNETGIRAHVDADNLGHKTRVYITPSLDLAKRYAMILPEEFGLGCAYRVEPEGEIGEDEADRPTPFSIMLGATTPAITQYYCSKAKILYPVGWVTPEQRQKHKESNKPNGAIILLGILAAIFLPKELHKPI